ncbi:heavy-metal-associated domain-containing protein [Bizionia sp.]|uniref:heavy-metal-associated domain-containing protein n=1 Tax=Bizionia sp. TaxID=1954480 RepID=UPI003A95439F
MIHTYTISGMTCNGCKNLVEDALIKLDAIQDIQIHIETSEASMTLKKEIGLPTLQEALPKQFTIKPNLS